MRIQPLPFADSSDVKFRGIGIQFTALANSQTTYDHTVTMDCLTNGMDIITNASHGDWISVYAVDAINYFGYGAGTIIDTFADQWGLVAGNYLSARVILNYAARMKKDFVVRYVYNNTSNENKLVVVNFYRHKSNQPIEF